MIRRSFLAFNVFGLIVLLIPTSACTETSGFSITCKFIFNKSADIYVRIVNQEQFDKRKGSICEAKVTIREDRAMWEIEPGKDSICDSQIVDREGQAKKKQITIKFDNIPQGRYGILCYQNVSKKNGNKKGPDTNFIGLPIEPWGVSNNARPFFSTPKFDGIAFDVNKNIPDMEIEIK